MPIELTHCRNPELFEQLCKFNTTQFKTFYGIFVYCWGNRRCFISDKNFFNLWCELNQLCHDLDESFPDQFDDYEVIRSFCRLHPYYFIERLPLELVSHLFAECVDNQVDVLMNVAKIILDEDIKATYTYVTNVFELDEPVDEAVELALSHMEYFSY